MKIYDKLGAKTAGIKARTVDKPTEKAPRTAPGMFLNTAQRIDAAEARVEALEAQLKAAGTGGMRIPHDQLHEKPGRRRKHNRARYKELEANIRLNGQAEPIIVQNRAEGGYWIESGHNRRSILRDLGVPDVWAVLHDIDEEQAELNAFYSNLLQTDLPDFEKYLGFKRIIERHPGLTHSSIADSAGLSRSFVTQLMAFGDLPQEAIDILGDKTDLIGANAAQDLAALTKNGRVSAVVQAIKRVAAGEIDQGRAVKEAAADAAAKAPKEKAEPIHIKAGRASYCSIQRADKVLRVQFQSAEEAQAVQEAVRELLERRAKMAT